VTLNKLGQHAEASEEFRQALAAHPQSAQVHNNLGFSLYLEKRYEEAERELARAVELQPNFRRAQMNRGLALGKLGRYEEALTAFTLASSEADAYYNLAIVQTEAQHYAEAARALERALVLNPDFADARQQLRDVSRLAAAEETKRAEAAAASEAEAQRLAVIAAEEEAARVAAIAAEEEAARIAAVAAAEARVEATEVVVAVEPAATVENIELIEPEAAPASVTLDEPCPEPVAEVVLAGSAEAVIPKANSALAIFQQIQSATNARVAGMPAAKEPAINADRLTALFAELVIAMKSDKPWYDDPQHRIDQLMGVLDTPK
jgi:Flp pilus assembly protein TadD